MTRFWQDAASVFETASAVADGSAANLAIVLDERNGLRILDGTGWTADALLREYPASTAYTVQRSGSGVIVEGRNLAESCTFRKNPPSTFLASTVIPHHLIRPAALPLPA